MSLEFDADCQKCQLDYPIFCEDLEMLDNMFSDLIDSSNFECVRQKHKEVLDLVKAHLFNRDPQAYTQLSVKLIFQRLYTTVHQALRTVADIHYEYCQMKKRAQREQIRVTAVKEAISHVRLA